MAKTVKFYSEGLGLEPVSADPASPSQGQMQYSDGTARTEGVWVYDGAAWIEVLATDTVACRYSSDGGQALPHATTTTLTFENLLYDTDSAFSGNTTFTVPTGKGGKYHIDAVIWQANTVTSQASIVLTVEKNGTDSILYSPVITAGSDRLANSVSGTVDLAAGDTIVINQFHAGNGSAADSVFVDAVNTVNSVSIIRLGD